MSGEIKTSEFKTQREPMVSLERVQGHDFRATKIVRGYDEYKLYGFHLIDSWQKKYTQLKNLENFRYSDILDNLCKEYGLGWELDVDEKTGLITQIALKDSNCQSRVFLDVDSMGNNEYRGEGLDKLHTAIIYQEFLAIYLSFLSGFKIHYPYIVIGGYGKCGSVDLAIPEKFFNSKKKVTSEYYQQQFELKASNICGQFGLSLKTLSFDEKGILQGFSVEEGNACDYSLGRIGNREYCPHNVDNQYQAAALHGIGAEFINDLLKRGSVESWR